MPVITSAVVAVTAAVVAGGAVAAGVATVATVATIGAVVGGIGLAVGVVGAITKNKDLIKVGSIMGALGAGAGLGAMAAGALGLGAAGASSATSAAAGAAGKSAAVSSTVEAGKSGAGAATQTVSTQAAPNLVNQSVGSSVTGSLPSSTTSLPGAVTGNSGSTLSNAMNGANATGQVLSQSMPNPGVDPPSTTALTSQATIAPDAGTKAPGMLQAARMGFGVEPLQAQAFSAPTTPGGTADKGFWGSLDPTTKLIAGMSGTHMVGSAIGGMMQGQSASNQLDLQKEQADRDQAQRELINSNNAYAPKITYGRPSGLIGRA